MRVMVTIFPSRVSLSRASPNQTTILAKESGYFGVLVMLLSGQIKFSHYMYVETTDGAVGCGCEDSSQPHVAVAVGSWKVPRTCRQGSQAAGRLTTLHSVHDRTQPNYTSNSRSQNRSEQVLTRGLATSLPFVVNNDERA